jgi:dihydroflavonol-4-reductase
MAGDKKKNRLNQDSWTNPKTDKVSFYSKSKTLAERAAWDFYNNQDTRYKMDLTVINPGPIYGPTLTGNLSGASMSMVKDIITGKLPMLPNIHYVMSDVRDVAKIHVKALENAKSNGERFIVTSENMQSMVRVAAILKENGYSKASPRKAPSFVVKFMSLFDREMKGMLPFVDVEINADISPTKLVFNWKPLPFEKTVLDTAKSIQPLL